MSAGWLLVTSLGLYLQKALGAAVPVSVLERAWVRRVLGLLPVALLAALTVEQSVGSPTGPVIDARLAGLAAAAVLLALRAPFLVVVVGAAMVAAGLRAAT